MFKQFFSNFRAQFSEITATSIHRAMQNLTNPNPLINAAVEVRQELDLRIGKLQSFYSSLKINPSFEVTGFYTELHLVGSTGVTQTTGKFGQFLHFLQLLNLEQFIFY